MRQRWCGRMVMAACGVMALCASAWGTIIVKEWNGHYYNPDDPNDPNNTYVVRWVGWIPEIRVLKPSGELPFNFEAYNDWDGSPATIDGILADPNMTGEVELILEGHENRDAGARSVYNLQFCPPNACATILKFQIIDEVGSVGHDTHIDRISAGVTTRCGDG